MVMKCPPNDTPQEDENSNLTDPTLAKDWEIT